MQLDNENIASYQINRDIHLASVISNNIHIVSNGPVLSTRKNMFSYIKHSFSIISASTNSTSPEQK